MGISKQRSLEASQTNKIVAPQKKNKKKEKKSASAGVEYKLISGGRCNLSGSVEKLNHGSDLSEEA